MYESPEGAPLIRLAWNKQVIVRTTPLLTADCCVLGSKLFVYHHAGQGICSHPGYTVRGSSQFAENDTLI